MHSACNTSAAVFKQRRRGEPTALDASMVCSWPWYRTLSPA
jgi:hypothetical protein